jgi:hypothetical protein
VVGTVVAGIVVGYVVGEVVWEEVGTVVVGIVVGYVVGEVVWEEVGTVVVDVGNQVGHGLTGQGIGIHAPVVQGDNTVMGTDFRLQPQLLQTVSVA